MHPLRHCHIKKRHQSDRTRHQSDPPLVPNVSKWPQLSFEHVTAELCHLSLAGGARAHTAIRCDINILLWATCPRAGKKSKSQGIPGPR